MKPPPRFAITRRSLDGSFARIVGKELHHLRDVVRLQKGAEIRLIDETGVEYPGTVDQLAPDHALIAIRDAYAEPSRAKVVLAAALIKAPRMDFLVEKAAELGATELLPLACDRSLPASVGVERVARWRRLAIAAAKQSLASPMVIHDPVSIAEMIRSEAKKQTAIFCTPDGDPLAKLVREAHPSEILLACGPEGDFSPHEISLMSDGGFRPASLGPHRLRSETAALAAISIVTGALDEMREEFRPRI